MKNQKRKERTYFAALGATLERTHFDAHGPAVPGGGANGAGREPTMYVETVNHVKMLRQLSAEEEFSLRGGNQTQWKGAGAEAGRLPRGRPPLTTKFPYFPLLAAEP